MKHHTSFTTAQVQVLAEAVTAHRRTMLWTIDSLHATDDEKQRAIETVVVCNEILGWTNRPTQVDVLRAANEVQRSEWESTD